MTHRITTPGPAVVVVGGGYAGVTAANRLTRRDDLAVTLVNPRPTFVERIRLHQRVGGSDDAVVDYSDVLADGVRLVVDEVERIDATRRRVALARGGTLAYDYLVYAVGSGSVDSRVPGAARFAYPVATFEEAERLRLALSSVSLAATVTVVGAGSTGIETAAELAELGRRVTLICGGPLGPYLHPRGRRAVAKQLARLGVTVLEGAGTGVTSVQPDAVMLDDGRAVPSTVTVWTAGFGVPDLAVRSGLSTDALGRLLTDETLTSIDDERIVAAGDSAAPSGLPLRMSCQAAEPLGAQAADTVLHRIAGTSPAPFVMGFTGQCISLGRQAGIFQFAHRDDTARGIYLGGRAAGTLKELVCRGTIAALSLEARRPGSLRLPAWFDDDSRRRRLAQRGNEPARLDVA